MQSARFVRARPYPLLAFRCAFFTQALYIKYFGVNLPSWDEWENIYLLDHYRSGALTLSELFAQHNEHRLFIARLAFLLQFRLFGAWDLRSQMLFSALVVAALAALWVYVLRRLHVSRWVVVASAALLVSPIQWENILWGFQIQFYALIFSLIVGIAAVALSDRISWRLVGIAIVACLCCSFSIASGLFSWAIIGACLLLKAWLSHGSLRRMLADRALMAQGASFALAALACGLFYLHDYHAPPNSNQYRISTFVAFLIQFGKLICYPILEERSVWRFVLAVLLWMVILQGLFVCIKRRAEPEQQKRLVLLSGLLLFLIVNAAIISYSRGGAAIAPRYATIFLWSSMAFLLSVDQRLLFAMSRNKLWVGLTPIALSAIVAGVLFVQLQYAFDSITRMAELRSQRFQSAADVIQYLADQSNQRKLHNSALYPDLNVIAAMLDSSQASLLPGWLRARAHALSATQSGDAWTHSGNIQSDQARDQTTSWGSWSGTDAHTGRLVSAPLLVREPILSIPIIGYPASAGNQLSIEVVGSPEQRITYSGTDPHEGWDVWRVDASKLIGRIVRIVAVDDSTTRGGWFGFDTPLQISRATLLQELFFAHLEYLIGIVVVGALAFAIVRTFDPSGGSAARVSRLSQVVMIGSLCCIGIVAVSAVLPRLSIDVLPATNSDLQSGTVDLLELLPAEYHETPALKRVPAGLFMHPDAALVFGPFSLPANTCFYSSVMIDPQVLVGATSDGVDFEARIKQDAQEVDHRTVTVLKGQPAEIVLPVPTQQLFTIELGTQHRDDPLYDWAIWSHPRMAPCG
jgi:hypothetical protein